ncbi:MAG TPA: oligoendopeptidase F [Bacilli bacterium]|nr:oligoendopeptidase F [Bacilli bacterium]
MNNLKREEVEDAYKWDVDKIYQGDGFKNDIAEVIKSTEYLMKYKGVVLKNANNLLESLELDLKISKMISKLYVYTVMLSNEDMTNNKNLSLVGEIDQLITTTNEKTAFFQTELLSGEYNLVLKYLSENTKLKKYSFYFEDLFRSKKHILPLAEEELIARLNEILDAPSDIFDLLNNSDITFSKFKDETGNIVTLNHSNYSKYIESYDRRVRKTVFKKLYKSYTSLKNTITKCLVDNIKVDYFISKTRKYDSPLQMSLYNNNIDPKLYDKLIKTVNNRIDLSYKYISLRKDILKLDKIHMYDLYVPLVKDINKKYSFDEAKDIVIKALSPLGDKYINDLKQAFSNSWIDIYYNLGKKSGAYSWGSYDTKPYLLLNYEGTLNSVSTLAHELGHSMHSYYSNHTQEYQYSGYSIFLAEIASTVNEILLNKYLYSKSTSKEEKLMYLNDLLESFRATLFRQTMFAEFEKLLYEKEQKEILTEESIAKLYLKLNKKYYGKNIVHDKEIKYEWMRIPHFYTSFYVYQYATGIAVATRIASDILGKKEGALENYLKFLKSGSSNYPLEILKKCGIDILNDDTIDKALDVFEETLNEFIKIYNDK